MVRNEIDIIGSYLDFKELEGAFSHIVMVVQWIINLHARVVHHHELKNGVIRGGLLR